MFKNKLNSFLLMNVSYSWHICHINGISRWYATNDYSSKADGAFQQQLMKNRYLYFNKFYHLPSCFFWQSVLFNSKIPIICEWRTFLMCFREIQRFCCCINHLKLPSVEPPLWTRNRNFPKFLAIWERFHGRRGTKIKISYLDQNMCSSNSSQVPYIVVWEFSTAD